MGALVINYGLNVYPPIVERIRCAVVRLRATLILRAPSLCRALFLPMQVIVCIEQSRQVCFDLANVSLHWQPVVAVAEWLLDLHSDLLHC